MTASRIGLAFACSALALVPGAVARAQTVNPNFTIALAPLAGPQSTPAAGQGAIGFHGTDLGITLKHEGQLRILFGDSWAGPLMPSIGPLGDDCQGAICLQAAGCPAGGVPLADGDAVQAFTGLSGSFFNRPGPPLVFRLNAFGLVAPLPVYAGGAFGTLLDMGPLKTPGAAFSNAKTGSQSGAFSLFLRPEAIACTASCANGFTCDTSLGIDVGGIGCVKGRPPAAAVHRARASASTARARASAPGRRRDACAARRSARASATRIP
jgi:hypothetical protein